IVPPAPMVPAPGAAVLTLNGIFTSHHSGTALRDISLAVRAGEILGIAGVSGNGQRAMAEVISGTRAPD
ncbi:ABC transporter ATP-binding protein, partial [Mesorhizobium sp. M7A.F.Ca.MR.148.00.0.0]